MKLVEPAIFCFLLFDVIADSLFVPAHRRYEVSSGPEIVPCEILSLPEEAPCDVDGTFPFDETHHLRDAVLGWYADQHVNVVCHQVTFHYLAFPLQGKLSEDLAQMPSKLFIESLPAVLWNPDYMVLAVPCAVT